MNIHMDVWKTILIAILSGTTVAFVNYFLFLKQKFRELERSQKLEAYGEFLDSARGFLNDPNLDFDKSFEAQQDFIKRFYNKIWVYASNDVIKSVDNFFNSVSISHTNDDDKTRALNELIVKIREDLGLKTSKDLLGKYRIYTPFAEKLREEKS